MVYKYKASNKYKKNSPGYGEQFWGGEILFQLHQIILEKKNKFVKYILLTILKCFYRSHDLCTGTVNDWLSAADPDFKDLNNFSGTGNLKWLFIFC